MTEPLPPQSSEAAASPPSFEAALARLETVVHELEDGRIVLLRQCFGLLESAERQIELLTGVDASGNPIVEPFDDTASTERSEQGVPRSRSRTTAAKKLKAGSAPTVSQGSESPNSSSGDSAAANPAAESGPGRNKIDVPRGLF
jgi:exodeoxyribonuclease VII small subunit